MATPNKVNFIRPIPNEVNVLTVYTIFQFETDPDANWWEMEVNTKADFLGIGIFAPPSQTVPSYQLIPALGVMPANTPLHGRVRALGIGGAGEAGVWSDTLTFTTGDSSFISWIVYSSSLLWVKGESKDIATALIDAAAVTNADSTTIMILPDNQ